jgi:hypothetical protein
MVLVSPWPRSQFIAAVEVKRGAKILDHQSNMAHPDGAILVIPFRHRPTFSSEKERARFVRGGSESALVVRSTSRLDDDTFRARD